MILDLYMVFQLYSHLGLKELSPLCILLSFQCFGILPPNTERPIGVSILPSPCLLNRICLEFYKIKHLKMICTLGLGLSIRGFRYPLATIHLDKFTGIFARPSTYSKREAQGGIGIQKKGVTLAGMRGPRGLTEETALRLSLMVGIPGTRCLLSLRGG